MKTKRFARLAWLPALMLVLGLVFTTGCPPADQGNTETEVISTTVPTESESGEPANPKAASTTPPSDLEQFVDPPQAEPAPEGGGTGAGFGKFLRKVKDQ